MKKYFSSPFSYVLLLMLTLTFQIGVESSTTSNLESVRLPGHIHHKAVGNGVQLNRLDASKQIPLTFILPLRH